MDLSKKLWDPSIRGEKYQDTQELQKWVFFDFNNPYLYWKTERDFLLYLNSIHLDYKEVICNIPRCLYFYNEPIYVQRKYVNGYKIIFTKTKKCQNCIFNADCKWIDALFLKIYGKSILRPIKRLTFEEFIWNLFIQYEPYHDFQQWSWTPPKIDHYKHVYRYLEQEEYTKDTSILEIGCYLGLFVDFLQKQWFTKVMWVDSDKTTINLVKEKSQLPLYTFDVFTNDISENIGKMDVIIMLWVFHNDYDEWTYDTTILSYCIKILENIHNALHSGGICIFSSHMFEIHKNEIEGLGFILIDSYLEEGSYQVYNYVIKKWR